MWYLWFLIGVLVGAIITTVICVIFYCRRSVGVLQIDQTNPEKDVYRFDIKDFDALSKKKRIIMKVNNDADLS